MVQPTSSKQLACDGVRLLRTPGHELSKLIKDGSLTATRLCELYIERIRQVQPAVNAMAQHRFEVALEEAKQIDRLVRQFREINAEDGAGSSSFSDEQLEMLRSPLLGVPISVKESIMIKGMKNSAGLWARRDTLAEQDAIVVSNAKRLGLIPICTTNIPELTMFWADCNNPVYGRSRNPYNPSRITGASSGGEGALIAAAGSLMGIGSDIGGSLRTPAHYCGIMSHKPSPFLISSEGNFPILKESRLRLFTLGPMCRYASDLRHLMKILSSDKDNPKQNSYTTHQPANIADIRRGVLKQLDEPIDLSKIKFFYCRFKKVSRLSALIWQRESRVQSEIMDAQQEVLNHFVSKFNCQIEEINLDKYLDKTFLTWQRMMHSGGTVDREWAFEPNEMAKTFGISNVIWESVKFVLGQSNHTKECLASLWFRAPLPSDRKGAYKICEKFERMAAEWKADLEAKLGQFGCVLTPTLPTVAHRHHFALLRTFEARFPSFWNVVQFPVSHATIRLDKKRGLPYGMTIASRPYNDALTITAVEEIEEAFGGWIPPPKLPLRDDQTRPREG